MRYPGLRGEVGEGVPGLLPTSPQRAMHGGALRCRTPDRLTRAALEAGGSTVAWDPGAAGTGVGG